MDKKPKAEAKVFRPVKKAAKSPFGVKSAPDDMKVEGSFGKRRLDRPGRKTGGRIGADSAPLSAAAASTRRGC